MPAHDRIYRTEGVVLRRHDLGEADRIVTLYTQDYGKRRVIARGARKPHSRKAGHVELFTRVDVLLSAGSTLDVISQVDTLDAYLPIRQNLVLGTYAGHFVELLDAFTEDEDENRSLYHLLVEGLRWISETTNPRRTARYYELHLLDLAGYRPQLNECVLCGTLIQAEDQFYSVMDGGVVCPSCGQHYPRAQFLPLGVLKVLRYLQRSPFEAVEKLELSDTVQRECERLMYSILTHFLERRLRSADFLDRLRRELPT